MDIFWKGWHKSSHLHSLHTRSYEHPGKLISSSLTRDSVLVWVWKEFFFHLSELTSAGLVHRRGVAAERKNLFWLWNIHVLFHQTAKAPTRVQFKHQTQELFWYCSDCGEKCDFCSSLGQMSALSSLSSICLGLNASQAQSKPAI